MYANVRQCMPMYKHREAHMCSQTQITKPGFRWLVLNRRAMAEPATKFKKLLKLLRIELLRSAEPSAETRMKGVGFGLLTVYSVRRRAKGQLEIVSIP